MNWFYQWLKLYRNIPKARRGSESSLKAGLSKLWEKQWIVKPLDHRKSLLNYIIFPKILKFYLKL